MVRLEHELAVAYGSFHDVYERDMKARAVNNDRSVLDRESIQNASVMGKHSNVDLT